MTLFLAIRCMMKKWIYLFPILCFLLTFLSGCVKLALQFSPTLVPNMAESLFEECDPVLAGDSLPADLKLLEGLLKSDPGNRKLQTVLCMGFAGYANLFVEEEDPIRASRLYIRARDYGFAAMGIKLEDLLKGETSLNKTLEGIDHSDTEALFWTTLSWNAWLNLNLDKPIALAQMGSTKACLERVLTLQPEYLYGAPHILKGTISAATPAMLGGNKEEAKRHFEKALAIGQRKFLMAHFFYARYYAVGVQDKDLFFALIEEVEKAAPDQIKEACLINSVIQQKAGRLKEMSEELFF